MNKKIAIQLFLLFIILLIFFSLYLKYFNDAKENNKIDTSLNKNQKLNILDPPKNLIKNISYNAFNSFGNNYEIKAESGKIDSKNSSIFHMKKVQGIIISSDQSIIKISSTYAKYNTGNYETNFSENVIVTFEDNIIKSDNLDLFFKKNLVYMANKIVYKNSNIELKADKLEIDMITKSSKIYMNNTNKKIEIKGNY